MLNGATLPSDHADYKFLAANDRRADIAAPTGSGAPRGGFIFNDVVYVFRDNAGGTAGNLWKSSAGGWVQVTFGRELQFTGAVGEITAGQTVTGLTSGATAVVVRAMLRTGTWTVSGVGTLIFASVTGTFQNGENVQVRQTTQYPWDGQVTLTLNLEQTRPFTLHLRIPGWCDQWSIQVNGAPLKFDTPPMNGYVMITRTWRPGDKVELNLAMPVQTVWAHPAVRQMQGRIALQRGPLVYCMEGADNGNIGLDRITLDSNGVAQFTVEPQPDLLGGVTVLRGTGKVINEQGWSSDTLYRRNLAESDA